MTNKKALITGITGQDGSYLAEFLLEKGYEVHGIIRRSSSFNTKRIDHIFDKLHLHYGDITDSLSIDQILHNVKPDEIYHLAAQSHVKVSFEIPGYTAQTDAVGTLNLLEAMRKHSPKAKLYNATTSELFGKVQEIPQKETTPFYPRSPYGVAKLYSYWIVKNYRESYGLFAVNGILFNHETLTEDMPLLFRHNGEIDIKPISEIVINHTNKTNKISKDLLCYQGNEVTEDLQVWDKDGWVNVTYASGYPHNEKKDPKNPKIIISKNAAFSGTSSHVCIMKDKSEKTFGELEIGDEISNINNFEYKNLNNINLDLARLLGFIVGDGSVDYKRNVIRLTNKNETLLNYYTNIWEKNGNRSGKRTENESGFKRGSYSKQQYLHNCKLFLEEFNDIYDSYHNKRIPKKILNGNKEIQMAFLEGYQDSDGLKKHKNAYKFRTFKTNSTTLLQGLIYLIKNTTDQNFNININRIFKWGKYRTYYSINLLSKQNNDNLEKYNLVKAGIELGWSQRKISREYNISRGLIKKITQGHLPQNNIHHFSIENNKIKKIINLDSFDGWFFDLETESGTFHAGIGLGHVHNSPRRGETFVTQKIVNGLSDYLNTGKSFNLGNIKSKRDWGHAKDFVRGMWMMIQQESPEDFVLATGKTRSIKEFIEECLKWISENTAIDAINQYKWIENENGREILWDTLRNKLVIGIDEKYFRPAEVDLLLGDASKAKEKLGWEPKISFSELVDEMMSELI